MAKLAADTAVSTAPRIQREGLLLLLVRRCFGQSWWKETLLLFFLVVEGKARRGDHACGNENDQVTFDVLIDIGSEQSTNERNITDDRRFILCLLHVFSHQSAEHDCLAVINADAGSDLACAEYRLIDHVFGK